MPGRFYELNIHYGVFVGGMGDFNEIFLGNQKNFRGCIENVFFNGLDVMVKAEDQASAIGDAKVLYSIYRRTRTTRGKSNSLRFYHFFTWQFMQVPINR